MLLISIQYFVNIDSVNKWNLTPSLTLSDFANTRVKLFSNHD